MKVGEKMVKVCRKNIPMEIRKSLQSYEILRVSKSKVTVALYSEEEDPLVLLEVPRNKFFSIDELVHRIVASSVSRRESEERAFKLLSDVVSRDNKLSFKEDFLEVRSKVGKFLISLSTGEVFRKDGEHVCVCVRGMFELPVSDVVLAKAIALAYTPQKIIKNGRSLSLL